MAMSDDDMDDNERPIRMLSEYGKKRRAERAAHTEPVTWNST